MTTPIWIILIILIVILVIACILLAKTSSEPDLGETIYITNNDPVANAVLVFRNSHKGICHIATVPTGGQGSGMDFNAAGSQSSIIVSPLSNAPSMAEDSTGRWLLVANSGSYDVSVLKIISPVQLRLVSRTQVGNASGAQGTPVSLAMSNEILLVLNSGTHPTAPASVEGFSLTDTGFLIPTSTFNLQPGIYSHIAFTPDQSKVVIAGKSNHQILVAPFGRDSIESAVSSPSTGLQPFSIAFDRHGLLFVVEAGRHNDVPMGRGITSYRIGDDGTIRTVSTTIIHNQRSNCWLASRNGYLYTSGSNPPALSIYSAEYTGKVKLRNGTAVTIPDINRPVDMALSKNGQYLYVLDPGLRSIQVYGTHKCLALRRQVVVDKLPGSAQGIAVF